MSIEVDFTDIDEEFIPAITGIINDFSDLRPLLERVVDNVLIPEHEEIFATDGRGSWERSPGSTRTNPILRDTLRLYGSLTDKNHPDNITDIGQDYLEFGSDVYYHDYHETGTSKFPANPVIGLWDVEAEVEEEFQLWTDEIIDRWVRDI